MNILIYLIIALLFAVLIFWSWNNTKDFDDTKQRITFIIFGIIILGVVTLIFFNISKIGIEYPKKEMANQVRKLTMLIFIPVNGFLSLPHIATIKEQIGQKSLEEEKIKRKIIILGVIFIITAIIEINYMKDFQDGIIQMLNNK